MSESLVLRIAALEKEVQKLRQNQEFLEMEIGVFDELSKQYDEGMVAKEELEMV